MKCPVCGSSATEFLIKSAPQQVVGNATVYTIQKCCGCGCAFALPRPSLDEVEQCYDADFFATSQQDIEFNEKGRTASDAPVYLNGMYRLRHIRSFMSNGRLLDIGCGKGAFLKLASDHFEVTGSELSPVAAAFCTDRLGLHVHQGDFLASDLSPKPFDMVTMWDSLGGFSNPGKCVDTIGDLLRPGGILAFTVPDIESIMFRITRQRWPLLIPPVNVTYFSRRAVHAILESRGFQVVSCGHPGKYVSVNFILRKLGRIFNAPSLDREGVGLPFVKNLYLNLLDIMTVVAVKTEKPDRNYA